MAALEHELLRHLAHLVGQELSVVRRAADMLGLGFGRVTQRGASHHGEYVLHVQCPWRLEGPQGIVTGRTDLWEPAEPGAGFDPDTWDYEQGNLQDRRIGELFGNEVSGKGAQAKDGRRLVVENVEADDFGGVVLSLSGGYRVVIFPAGSTGEDWRLFRTASSWHLVVSGGRIEGSPDDR